MDGWIDILHSHPQRYIQAHGPCVDRPGLELKNMVLNARLMTEAALTREESRGAHFRNDFPTTRDIWRRRVIFKKD